MRALLRPLRPFMPTMFPSLPLTVMVEDCFAIYIIELGSRMRRAAVRGIPHRAQRYKLG